MRRDEHSDSISSLWDHNEIFFMILFSAALLCNCVCTKGHAQIVEFIQGKFKLKHRRGVRSYEPLEIHWMNVGLRKEC
jgi:hypothetical protein